MSADKRIPEPVISELVEWLTHRDRDGIVAVPMGGVFEYFLNISDQEVVGVKIALTAALEEFNDREVSHE